MKALLIAALALAPAAHLPAATRAEPSNYVSCRIHKTEPVTFPLRLLHEGVTHGEVSIVMEIDTEGKVTDQLVSNYTRREFADEVLRAMKSWRYEPGTVAGRPVISVLTLTFDFTVNGVVVHEKRGEMAVPDDDRGLAYFAHGPASLDRKPVAIAMPAPAYPAGWIREGRRGSVVVRFYVDESGCVRMPISLQEEDPLLAGAAVAAVKEWKFEPPLAGGRPVLASVEQTFVFRAPENPGRAEPAVPGKLPN